MLNSTNMAAIRDNLCELGRLEIPRPKCTGMQFIATRGRQGFYRTIRENGAKYGLQIKPQGPKRPQLSSELFSRPMTLHEENAEDVLNEDNHNNVQKSPKERNNNVNVNNSIEYEKKKSNFVQMAPKMIPMEKPPAYPTNHATRQITIQK
ncbi:unnamed protein product [Caenorhabditis bovis]|uniref:Uncharacterized protein n=1 Tax=Caenorhabditis bovis TaxID=2654633 RepID=A0A8S1EHF3_9PELO|nr:unnamed protein product [Caenorhabditis bovis]